MSTESELSLFSRSKNDTSKFSSSGPSLQPGDKRKHVFPSVSSRASSNSRFVPTMCFPGVVKVFVYLVNSFITRQTPRSSTRTGSTSGHHSSTHTPATAASNTPAANRSANIVGKCIFIRVYPHKHHPTIPQR